MAYNNIVHNMRFKPVINPLFDCTGISTQSTNTNTLQPLKNNPKQIPTTTNQPTRNYMS